MSGLIGSDGLNIPDGAPQTIVYDGSNVDYIEYTCGTRVYRQTFTYSGGQVSAISIPVLQ